MEIKSKMSSLKIQRHGNERLITVELSGSITEEQEKVLMHAFHHSSAITAQLDVESTPLGSVCSIKIG